jgi:uncharacterized membrane protein (UPF0127 family)
VIRVLTVLALVLTAECERTPPEDFGTRSVRLPPAAAMSAPPSSPAASATTAPSTARNPTQAADGRCVLETPAQPPPAVAPGPARGCPADPEGGPPKVPLVTVGFPDLGPVAVDAELVRSEHDTQRGLMYRTSMPEEHGMLFDLRERDDHQFWMHNTCIPLDLLYIDEDGLLVGIVENAPTLDDTTRGVGCPSRWVLEVNAGWSRRHGVRAGQHVRLPSR